MNKTQEKAREIALKNRNAYFEDDHHIGITSEAECFDSAMEMAEWKDEQIIEILKVVKSMIWGGHKNKIDRILDKRINWDEL